jgi:hypothetical protein
MTAGALLIVRTRLGDAEARRMERTEAGQSRWCIHYAWGTETFDGLDSPICGIGRASAVTAQSSPTVSPSPSFATASRPPR